MQKCYKAKDLAEILDCNPATIYRLADNGFIGSVKIGGLRRFYLLEEEGQSNDTEGESFKVH